ncbi:tetratricopeptide repeat protein [Propionivibrio sp.]|uniref:tetratricopeptide repeat protein n=1 Tax=Propionivibrio sp. TaxID=2212460 RepID=UPI003BF1F9DB
MPQLPQAPEIYQIPLDQVDTQGLNLPPKTDSDFEQALITHTALHYASRDWNAAVVVSEGFLRVVAVPQSGVEPKKYLLGLLREGFIEDALPGLEALYGMIDDPDVAFNFGVALSELGRVEESLAPLNKCLSLDPAYDNAAIALGVSLAKLGRHAEAEEILKIAAKIQPDNPLIKQNLAATLARAGKFSEALPAFRQAASLAPNNPACLMGLAQCLDSIDPRRDASPGIYAGVSRDDGLLSPLKSSVQAPSLREETNDEHRVEALKIYKQVIQKFPSSPFTETAKQILNRAGQDDLRKPVEGGHRPDAIEYMAWAIEHFDKLPKAQVGQITMEIGLLGEQGLEINNPTKRYTLKNLQGDFSGLQLLCMMHVGMAMFDPHADCGSGLTREFEIAKGLSGK